MMSFARDDITGWGKVQLMLKSQKKSKINQGRIWGTKLKLSEPAEQNQIKINKMYPSVF
jgi:hypothetical protein